MAEEMLASPDSPLTIKPTHPITYRFATLLDAPQIGRLAAKTYYNTALTDFLSPNRAQYPSHYIDGFVRRATQRMLSPRNTTYLATTRDPVTGKEKVVGSAQFVRLGDDAGAWKQVRSKGVVWRVVLWVLSWVLAFWWKVADAVGGEDKSANPEGIRLFGKWGAEEEAKHWDREGRRDRWHAQSVVVDPWFHRRGFGRKLMREVTRRAEEEGVPVGLESSAAGELLYGSLGFEVLGRFEKGDFEQGSGGVMMYKPRSWKEKGL